MKFKPDTLPAQAITGYGPGWVALGAQKLERSLILGSRGERQDWACARFEDLSPAHFLCLAQLHPELVIFGSGARLRFAPTTCTRPLIDAQIGLETMDTQAACRTYNILAGEGRHVILAVLLGTATG